MNIRWTEEERNKIRRRAQSIVENLSGNKTIHRVDLLRKAQLALPESRQRTIVTVSEKHNKWFIEFCEFHVPDDKVESGLRPRGGGKPSNKARIHWTEREWKTLVRFAAIYLIEHPGEKISNPELLMKAQEVLEPHRQKNSRKTLYPKSAKFGKDVKEMKQRFIANPPHEITKKKEVVRDTVPAQKNVEVKAKVVQQQNNTDLSAVSTQDLMETLFNRFSEQVATQAAMLVDQTITERFQEVEKRLARVFVEIDKIKGLSTVVPPYSNRPKVLVVGLLPKQVQSVKSMYSRQVDLTFKTSDQAKQMSDQDFRQKDGVIFSKFVSHAATAKLSNDQFVIVKGGLSQISKELDKIIQKHNVTQAV